MDALDVITNRISANVFDPNRSLSQEEIEDLVRYAMEAPSSYNIQHTRFIAVTDQDAKERLKAVAYNQPKVADAAVTFIVLGDLRGYEKLADILQRSVALEIIDEKMKDMWVNSANTVYSNNERFARDEAIRSGSMAAMTMMIAAEAKGLVSGPMIGFDPEGVKREFEISDRYVPVMLLTVGYAAEGNWPRKPRLLVDEVLSFNESKEF